MDDHRQAYRAMNASFGPRYLHHFGRGAGFSAEFIHVLKAVAECLGRRVQFCLQTDRRPQGFAVESGWTDYFEPLWPEVSAGLAGGLNRSQFVLDRVPVGRAISRPILKRLSGCTLFLFDGIGRPPEHLDIPELGLGMSYWENMQHLCRMLWTYNAETKKGVDLLRTAPPAENFLAAHIRRGDKQTEADYTPVALYAEAIKKCAGELKTVYVATDDQRTVEQLANALGPTFHIFSYVKDEAAQGYDQEAFNDSGAEQRRQKTLELFAELETVFRSTLFFGTPTSNIFNLVRYMRANTGMVPVG